MANNTLKIFPEPVAEGQPSKLVPKSCFTSEDTTELTYRFYEAEDGSVAAGVWECAPCKFDIESYPVNEQMTIISGKLVLTRGDGVEETFGPGEVVFAAKGSEFTWHVTEYLRKYYMTA